MKKNYSFKYIFNSKNILILIVGLYIAFYISSCMLGQSGIVECFDQKKYVLNLNPDISESLQVDINGKYHVLDDKVSLYNMNTKNFCYYNYFIVNISSDNENARAVMNIYDDMGALCEMIPIELSNTDQVIEMRYESVSSISIDIENMKGDTFDINTLQLRTHLPFENWNVLFLITCICLGFYFLIVIIIRRLIASKGININHYVLVEYFMYLYASIKRKFIKEIKFRNEFVRYIIIGIILSAIFYKMYSVPFYEDYNSLLLFEGIALIIITKLVSRESNIKLQWNNPLALSWMVLSSIMICSELITNQVKGYVGYFNIIIFGSLFFTLGISKNQEKFIESLKTVILVTFVPCIIQCLFFYSYTKGIVRYTGVYGNSNQFAAYVIVVFAVVVSDIDFYLTNNKFKIVVIIDIILLGFSSCFLWLTQSRTTLLAMFGIVFVEIIKILLVRKRINQIKKNILIFLIMLVTIPSVWIISLWTINNISLKDCTSKIVVKEMELPINLEMTAYASDNVNRMLSTLKTASSLSEFSNNRFDFWATHFRNMNLFGHKDYLYMESLGDISPSHNSIIGMMYKYGILAGIPYIFMLFYSFWYAIKYFLKYSFKRKNAMLPLNIVIAFLMCAMLDTIDERPFWKMLWLVFYIVVGILMNMDNEDIDDNYNEVNNHSINGGNKFYSNKFRKYIFIVGIVIIGIHQIVKLGYVGFDIYKTKNETNSIFTENISNKPLQDVNFILNSLSSIDKWDDKEEMMPANLEGDNPTIISNCNVNYLYYQNNHSRQIELAASGLENNWEILRTPILETGKRKTFDEVSVNNPEIVYVAPYYYMIYIGENSVGKTGIGLAISNDGIVWTKKNVRGIFKEDNVKDTKVTYDAEAQILSINYITTNSTIMEAKINISQNRDMTQFDTESDWTTSLVSSENILNGSYAIEGETGTKNVWMQSESSIDLYYKKESAIININGYMPLEQYLQKNIDSVNLTVKINGQSVYEKIFKESEVFDIQIPIDTIDKKGEDYMHIELITDADFNPKELGGSEDGRDLSYILYNLKQE